jgi:threonine/homoserine/homoserine lactone efflux protein
MTPSAGLRQGLISNLTNPKMIAFFPALLPQFVPAGQPAFAVLLALGVTFSLMTLTWLTAYAFVVTKAGDLLRQRFLRRSLEAATGVVLIGLGIRLARESA